MRECLAFLVAFFIGVLPAKFIQAACVYSDGSDGAFSPSSSMVLQTNESGRFNFTTVFIPRDVLVSIDSLGKQDIIWAASGDVEIDGALDVRDTTLTIQTPGRVTLQGKIYGKGIGLVSQELVTRNNPNGNPDQWLTGGVDTKIKPDGFLTVDQPYASVNASSLAGVVMSASFVQVPLIVNVAPIVAPTVAWLEPPQSINLELLTISNQFQAVPLPASMVLMLTGLAGVSGFVRRSRAGA